jgi:predicted RNase H-like nuclease
LQRYQALLATLAEATPPLGGLDALLTDDPAALRGRALKAYEDTLDAITCAYTAYYLWHHGPARTRVYGTIADGHILTPPLPPF